MVPQGGGARGSQAGMAQAGGQATAGGGDVAGGQQPAQVAPGGACRAASGGAQDVCRATTQDVCCVIPGGSKVISGRLYPAGSGRYCQNPDVFYDCGSTTCVPKGTQQC
jgi:hypothetical protein